MAWFGARVFTPDVQVYLRRLRRRSRFCLRTCSIRRKQHKNYSLKLILSSVWDWAFLVSRVWSLLLSPSLVNGWMNGMTEAGVIGGFLAYRRQVGEDEIPAVLIGLWLWEEGSRRISSVVRWLIARNFVCRWVVCVVGTYSWPGDLWIPEGQVQCWRPVRPEPYIGRRTRRCLRTLDSRKSARRKLPCGISDAWRSWMRSGTGGRRRNVVFRTWGRRS